MVEKEKIKVYIDFQQGKCICICMRCKKGCEKQCTPDVVTRDRFAGWQALMRRDRYGR